MIEERTSKTNIPELARELLHLPFSQVVPSETNPRLNLDKEPFEELKKSIFANGLLQPIVVRPKGDTYEIIGGHRRYFAVKDLAGEHKGDKRFTRIAVVVVHVADEVVPVMQLAENLNRSDLSPVEIADGVARAMRSGVEATKLAENLGWSRRNIRRYVQLAEAPQWFRDFAREVRVSMKKLDDKGAVVIDAKTNKPAIETERFPALQFAILSDLLDLFSVLREADALQLEEVGGENFRPLAEKTTKRLAIACAVEGWSHRRLRDEIKRAKDPKPRDGGTASTPRSPLAISGERCVIELRRVAALPATERAELAMQLTKALSACKFKSVVITP